MDSHFQVIILGTGLTESIAAAALAKAGLKVAHIDANPYYGADEANLTTKELQGFISNSSEETKFHTSLGSASLCGTLPTSSRDYSLSLRPSIIPSRGPLISALISSGVARYGNFKLLESVSVYSTDGFKNVPGSKEDIFKSNELSLIDKRRLMRFLVFANGEFESSAELQGKEDISFISFLQEVFTLNDQLASALAYALALCQSSNDRTFPALHRIRCYLRSAGRYGPSPFLVGQYGGLGELAQGFCRVCAVSGGTYILGRDILTVDTVPVASTQTNESKIFRLKLSDVPEELTADLLISSVNYLPYFNNHDEAEETTPPVGEKHAYCIVLIDDAISRSSPSLPASKAEGTNDAVQKEKVPDFEDDNSPRPVDAALLVFPPGELASGKAPGSVSVLVNGAGTLSCPPGKSILYLSTTVPLDTTNEGNPKPELLLRPYLDATLSLLRTSDSSPLSELSSAFYIKSTTSASPSQLSTLKDRGIIVSSLLPGHLAEAGDAAATNAETIFREALRRLGRDDAEDLECWPPLPAGLDDDDDVL